MHPYFKLPFAQQNLRWIGWLVVGIAFVLSSLATPVFASDSTALSTNSISCEHCMSEPAHQNMNDAQCVLDCLGSCCLAHVVSSPTRLSHLTISPYYSSYLRPLISSELTPSTPPPKLITT